MNKIAEIKPMVSVVMITYNHEPFIAEAIEGVLMQMADFPIELIIANDCSPDRTNEIVQNYINNHPNGKWITCTRHPNNKGMMPNFIWALKQAKGKYIALCEGDDYWTDPLKLQKQVDFLETNSNVVISSHGTFTINNQGIKIEDSLPEKYKNDAKGEELKKMFWIVTLTMVFRNIQEVQNDLKKTRNAPNGDSYLISILGNYGDFHFHKDIMPAAYRVHSAGVWSMLAEDKKMKNHFITLNELLKFYLYKNDIEMIQYYKQKIDQNTIKQFDYSMNNNSFLTKAKVFWNTLLKHRNWQKKSRLFYLIKSYIKSIITK